jgi:hypothetical protein
MRQHVPRLPSELLQFHGKILVKSARKYDTQLIDLAISAIAPDVQRPLRSRAIIEVRNCLDHHAF